MSGETDSFSSAGALPLAVGFAFAKAAFAGGAFEGVFFVEVFGSLELGDAGGERLGGGAGRVGGVSKGEQEDELAADAAAGLLAGGKGGVELLGGAAEELFVEFGEFAGKDDLDATGEEGGEVRKGVEDAVRGFVEEVGAGWECFQRSSAGSGFFGEEAVEGEGLGREA